MPPTSTSRASILPVYLVCDLSGSMAHDGRIEALTDAVTSIRDAFWSNPVVSDAVRLSIITFSTEAVVLLPLCDLALEDELPEFRPGGLTSYAAAFRKLGQTIRSDVGLLVADDYRVYRPLIYFFSDGAPTDPRSEWVSALRELVDPNFPHRPEIVALGVAEATAETLGRVATLRCCVGSDQVSVASAIAGVGELVVRSVVASGVDGRLSVPGLVSGLADAPILDLL